MEGPDIKHKMDNTVRLWTLLSKQQGGELSDEEQLELADLQKDPANQQALATYAGLSAYWKRLATEKGTDTASYWQKQQLRLEAAHNDVSFINTDDSDIEAPIFSAKWHQKTRIWIGAAAVILIAFGIGLIFKFADKSRIATAGEVGDTVIVVHNGDQKQISLPDGSKVWLNSGSELSYNKYFAKAAIKEITLKGEAFFDIKHDPNRTFIIHTEYLDIKDLGTRFNVKAYEDEDKMETTLINGLVEVYPKNHPEQMVRLQPNEKVVFDTKVLREGNFHGGTNNNQQKVLHLDSIQSRISVPKANNSSSSFYIARLAPKIQSKGDSIVMETAWMQHQLAFSAEPFEELAKNMERWFDVHIDITNPAVGNYIFSGIFKEETFQEALSELQMIQPFQYELEGRKVRIY